MRNSIRYEMDKLWSPLNTGTLLWINFILSINCHDHNTTTKHDENKYKAFALNLQGAVREQFPLVQVIIKPIATDQDEKVKHLKIDFSKEQDKPTLIDG